MRLVLYFNKCSERRPMDLLELYLSPFLHHVKQSQNSERYSKNISQCKQQPRIDQACCYTCLSQAATCFFAQPYQTYHTYPGFLLL